MKLLFGHTEWMSTYQSQKEAELLRLQDNRCACNFQDYNGACYGYMNNAPQLVEDTLEDVLVVWVSKDEYEENDVVVGWHHHATVYAKEQTEPDIYGIGRELCYYTKAKSEDCFLLAPESRQFVITESGKSDPALLSALLDYIEACKEKPFNLRLNTQTVSAILHQPGLNYDELMEAGEDAIEDEEYYKALLYFNTAFHAEKTIDAIFNIGSMLQCLCCFHHAIPVFEKLRELEGNEPDTLDLLLNLYMQTNQYNKALDICNLSLEQAEETEELCGLLCVQSNILVKLNQPQAAIKCLDYILTHSEDELMKHEVAHCKEHLLRP